MRVALKTGTNSSALALDVTAITAAIAIVSLQCGFLSKSFLPLRGVSRDQARLDEDLRLHDQVDLAAAELGRRDDGLEIPIEKRRLELRAARHAREIRGGRDLAGVGDDVAVELIPDAAGSARGRVVGIDDAVLDAALLVRAIGREALPR